MIVRVFVQVKVVVDPWLFEETMTVCEFGHENNGYSLLLHYQG